MNTSNWISMAALLMSVWAIYTSRKALKIEQAREKDRVTEGQRAKLVARIQKIPRAKGADTWKLMVANNGEGIAKEIKIWLENTLITEHSNVMAESQPEAICSDSCVTYPLAVHLGWAPPFHVSIRWTDESNKMGFWEGEVS